MSMNKDELLLKLNKLIEKHGFVADKETLDKSIKEYDVSSFTNEELISKCKEVAIRINEYNEKDAGLISELMGRYRNLILTKEAEAISQTTDVEESSNKEDENVKEMTIKTVRGDIPVKVIKMNGDDIKIVSDVFADFFTNLK